MKHKIIIIAAGVLMVFQFLYLPYDRTIITRSAKGVEGMGYKFLWANHVSFATSHGQYKESVNYPKLFMGLVATVAGAVFLILGVGYLENRRNLNPAIDK